MLPEFADATDAIQEALYQKMDAARKVSSATFDRARKRIYHEGDQHASENSGLSEPSEFAHLQCEMYFHKNDLVTMTRDEFERRFSEMGKELGEKKTAFHWSVIRKATEQSDSVMKREKGEPLVESIFKMLEVVHMSFDDGNNGPSLYVPPSHYDALIAAQNEIRSDPELTKRLIQLMQRKYEQWRAEEANRKLVD